MEAPGSGASMVGDTGIEPVTPTVSTFSDQRWLCWLQAYSVDFWRLRALVGLVTDDWFRLRCCTTVARRSRHQDHSRIPPLASRPRRQTHRSPEPASTDRCVGGLERCGTGRW